MDSEGPPFVKKEMTFEKANHDVQELIIPDLTPSEEVSSQNGECGVGSEIKAEPEDTSGFMDGDDGLENPYQCFECGLDCTSQGELIDHYESAHPEERKSESNGNVCDDVEVDDPLAGDVAPDSPEKAASVEGAQNASPTHEFLLLYSCPCCGHSSTEWSQLVQHLAKHVQVTSLSCSNCVYKLSSSYHLKDYEGRDSSDQPHVCCHCPFKTQWYQEWKNHCVTHHKNDAVANSFDNQKCAPINNISIVKSITSPSALVQPNKKIVISQKKDSVSPLRQAGYLVLTNNSDGQNVGNITVRLQNFFPGAEGPLTTQSRVIVPQVEFMNHSSASTVQKTVDEATRSAGVPPYREDPKTTPTLLPKLEGSDGQPTRRLLPPKEKPAKRDSSPKVPVNELIEKWSFAKVVPKPPHLSPKASEAPLKSDVPLLLTGMPPCRAPRGSLIKSRGVIRNKPCPYCSHMARDGYSLKTHILTHTKEKPFACEFCAYRATQKAHLTKHMKTHIWGRRKK